MIDKIERLRSAEAEAYEAEHHLHNRERWCGAAAGWDGTNEVDATDPNRLNPFFLDAGNDTWGTPVCVIGSSDTPVIAGMNLFDPHELLITAVENAKNAHKKIRVAWGTSYAQAIIDDTFTEEVFVPLSNRGGNEAIDLIAERLPAGTKVFVSMWGFGEDTCTLDFIMGIHEYIR